MSRKVSKVVIPVAGLGSRFLPATKSLPKELLPIIDTPIIHYIVQEAVEAGFTTVCFVTSRPKVLIEDYFDPHDLTAMKLEKADKTHLLESILKLSAKINIVSVRQYEPLGLGHAILQAAPVVGDENFAVILGDDIIRAKSRSAIAQCLDKFQSVGEGSVVGVVEVPRDETHMYGIVDMEPNGRVRDLIEKPKPEVSPSTWAIPGRYIFEPHIMSALRETPPGLNGEIQLTDAMRRLVKSKPFHAVPLNGERFDTGDKIGYIKANVAFALDDPAYSSSLRSWLRGQI
jgi:UTP--glucose-1-phosphate uridylyltransferase